MNKKHHNLIPLLIILIFSMLFVSCSSSENLEKSYKKYAYNLFEAAHVCERYLMGLSTAAYTANRLNKLEKTVNEAREDALSSLYEDSNSRSEEFRKSELFHYLSERILAADAIMRDCYRKTEDRELRDVIKNFIEIE